MTDLLPDHDGRDQLNMEGVEGVSNSPRVGCDAEKECFLEDITDHCAPLRLTPDMVRDSSDQWGKSGTPSL
jgi:hypothetical protein